MGVFSRTATVLSIKDMKKYHIIGFALWTLGNILLILQMWDCILIASVLAVIFKDFVWGRKRKKNCSVTKMLALLVLTTMLLSLILNHIFSSPKGKADFRTVLQPRGVLLTNDATSNYVYGINKLHSFDADDKLYDITKIY